MGKKRNKQKKLKTNDWNKVETIFGYTQTDYYVDKEVQNYNLTVDALGLFEPKTTNQKRFLDVIEQNIVTFCEGSAGTGKSYVALQKACEILFRDNDADNEAYEKILIFHPLTQVEDTDLGYLPGTVEQKVAPFKQPSVHILEKILGEELLDYFLSNNFVEFHPLNYIRGWTYDNVIVIIEEAQNLSKTQMKAILTRIGENCKVVVIGDSQQSDRFGESVDNYSRDSGLKDAIKRLKDIENVGTFTFDVSDVVRSKIVKDIIIEYEK